MHLHENLLISMIIYFMIYRYESYISLSLHINKSESDRRLQSVLYKMFNIYKNP